MNLEKSSWKFSDDEKRGIVELWKSGLSTYSIARKFDCDDEPIRNIIKRRLPRDEYMKIVSEHMKKFEEKNRLKVIVKPDLNENLAWWIGVVKGDGCVKKYSIVLGVREREFRDRWASVGEKLFGMKAKNKTIVKNGKEFYLSFFNSILLIRFLRENYGKFGRYVWDIPSNLQKEPGVVFGFLRGLFDSEGCAKFYPRRSGTSVTMVSVNKDSVFEIEKILNRFKIRCRIYRYRRKDRINDYYIINIGSFCNIGKFYKYINFTITRKRNKLSNYINYIMLGEDYALEN